MNKQMPTVVSKVRATDINSGNHSAGLPAVLKLSRALLCLDCEVVFSGKVCPVCTSESFIPLARWLS